MSSPPETLFDDTAVWQLYEHIHRAWNLQDTAAMATPFVENRNLVGFDGSQINLWLAKELTN